MAPALVLFALEQPAMATTEPKLTDEQRDAMARLLTKQEAFGVSEKDQHLDRLWEAMESGELSYEDAMKEFRDRWYGGVMPEGYKAAPEPPRQGPDPVPGKFRQMIMPPGTER